MAFQIQNKDRKNAEDTWEVNLQDLTFSLMEQKIDEETITKKIREDNSQEEKACLYI